MEPCVAAFEQVQLPGSHLGRVTPNPWDRCCYRFFKTGPGHLLVVKLHDVAINYSCYLVLALTDVPLFHCTVITSELPAGFTL